MIARGASTGQIIKLLLTESLIIVLLAVVIGAFTGVASGFGKALVTHSRYRQPIPIEMIIPSS